MRYYRKVRLIPTNDNKAKLIPFDEYQIGGNMQADLPTPPLRGHALRTYAQDKQRKLLLVILQLAKRNAYSDDLKLKSRNGNFIEQTQFINLLNYALSPGKALPGVNDFIDILYDSKITPEMLINENVKSMLRDVYKRKGHNFSKTTTESNEYIPPPETIPETQPVRDSEPIETETTEPDVPDALAMNQGHPMTEETPSTSRTRKRRSEVIKASELRPADSHMVTRAKQRMLDSQQGSGWDTYDSDDE